MARAILTHVQPDFTKMLQPEAVLAVLSTATPVMMDLAALLAILTQISGFIAIGAADVCRNLVTTNL